MLTFTKSLSNDFSGNLHTEQLKNEINNSSILLECVSVKNILDDVNIIFDTTLGESLSSEEETTLNTIISNHVPDVTVEKQIVTVQEELVSTNGKWKAKAMNITGATGPDVETSSDHIWEWPISVLDIQVRTVEDNAGDYVKLEVIPPDNGFGEGVIGSLTSLAPTGATGLFVNKTVIDNILPTDHLSLKEGGKEEDLGAILSIDKVNNIVYCQNATLTEFSHTSPAFIKFKRYVLEDFLLGPPDRYPLGDSKIGASYVPAGNIVRATYINKGATEKKLYCVIEYLE
jgi:hypothetical protein